MYYFDDITEYDGADCAIMLGKFDGLHIGHRALLSEMKKNHGELRMTILTFDGMHYGEHKDLFTKREKRIICEDAGLEAYLNVPFTDEIRRMTPKEFIEGYLCGRCHAKQIYVGENWRFGRNREGNTKILRKLCNELGIEAFILSETELSEKGRAVSCTDIRTLISAGRTEEATELLGGYYFVAGRTKPGRKLGTELHFPTLNLYPDSGKLLPKNGVYLTTTRIGRDIYPSVTNVGTKPTVTDELQVVVETHLCKEMVNDIDYYTDIVVYFRKMLREEQKFSSLSELSEQIGRDKAAAIAYFESTGEVFA